MPLSAKIVKVNIPGSNYNVVVQPGLISSLSPMANGLLVRKVAVVTDSTVAQVHLSSLQKCLKDKGIESISAVIPAGESHKTLANLLPVYDTLLSAGMERSTTIVALGGGVVGDMAGFVAATILRGVPFVQIPTTLLAMVDAGVGGKTGVDHAVGKNLIGAFHQPKAVLIDPEMLKTLPPRELRNGLAECVKHDLIRDSAGFENLSENLDAILALDMAALTELIAHNVSIKARVVEADPFEQGERAHLNFGHTFGHAMESVSNFAIAHGAAVALGMCAASYVSMKLGLLSDSDQKKILNTITKTGLPTHGLMLNIQQVADAMQFDKKVKSGKIRFVLLDGIGKATIRDDVPAALVREALETLR